MICEEFIGGCCKSVASLDIFLLCGFRLKNTVHSDGAIMPSRCSSLCVLSRTSAFATPALGLVVQGHLLRAEFLNLSDIIHFFLLNQISSAKRACAFTAPPEPVPGDLRRSRC